MNGNALRYFIAIAEQGSLRAAADVLHISQSALSRQILNLEDEIKAPLLERLPRGIALTEAGRIFLRYARANVANIDLAISEVSALQGVHRGTVKIAAQEAFMEIVLPSCIRMFRAKYPLVKILAEVSAAGIIVSKVQEGAVDFGLAFNPELDIDMQRHFSISEKIVAVFSPSHPLTDMEEIRLSDVIPYALALPPPESATGNLIYRAARTNDLILQSAIESSSVRLRLNMIGDSDLGAIMADVAARPALLQGRLMAKPLLDPVLNQGTITLFSSPERRLSGAARMLQDFVYDHLNGSATDTSIPT